MWGRFMTVVLAASVVALGSCAASFDRRQASSPAAQVHTPRCHPLGAHLLAVGPQARVFALAGTVYACAVRTGRRYELGRATTCMGSPQAGPVAVSGELVAYGLRRCGIDTGSAEVAVLRLSDGRQRLRAPATTLALGPESYVSVVSLVVRADGAVAWIATGNSIAGVRARDVEVDRGNRRIRERLDAGAAIDPASLRLHGSRLTWKHGGSLRTARLE